MLWLVEEKDCKTGRGKKHGRSDSNARHLVLETSALPTELHPYLAEREGFEPPVPHSTTVFKTAAIDHSAISP
jgi:hypothetical protein